MGAAAATVKVDLAEAAHAERVLTLAEKEGEGVRCRDEEVGDGASVAIGSADRVDLQRRFS